MKAGTEDRRRRIGERIRAAREGARLSQIELARLLSVSNSIISSWETGRASISADDLALIAQALEKPAGYFYGDVPPRRVLDQFDPADILTYLASRSRRTGQGYDKCEQPATRSFDRKSGTLTRTLVGASA